MISFQERTLVNGSTLRNFSGQHVSIHVNVPTEVERQATSIKAKTTDDIDVTISLSEPLNAPVKGWIEVIGVPTGPNTIRNKEVLCQFSVTHYCEIILISNVFNNSLCVHFFLNFARSSFSQRKVLSHTTKKLTIKWSLFGTTVQKFTILNNSALYD